MQKIPTLLGTPSISSVIHFDAAKPLSAQFYHRHQDTEFIFIDQGTADFSVDDRSYAVSSGNILLLNANVEHGTADAGFSGYSVMFSDLMLKGLPPGFLIPEKEDPVLDVKSEHFTLSHFLKDAAKEFAQNTDESGKIASLLLNAVLLKIVRFKYAASPDHYASISERTKKFIEQNYHLELSLNDLANQIYVSPYHLSRTFKDEAGVSPIQYLIQHRIEIAKKLLENSNLPVSEIAYKVGYPNANYFNLIFKKIAGTSPGKYRKKNIG